MSKSAHMVGDGIGRGGTIPFADAFKAWLKVAALSFGGPAGQIAVIHRIFVDEKKWVGEGRFLRALNYCMLLPGPEAQQLATYLGWTLHGIRGGLTAGLLFVLPGFLSILALSILYVAFREVPFVSGVFFGVKAVVLAIVIDAVRRIGARALKTRAAWSIAAAAFIGIFFLDVRFPVIVIGAGLLGYALAAVRPDLLGVREAVEEDVSLEPQTDRSWLRALKVAGVCIALWFAPIIAAVLITGNDSVFTQLGLFFSKMAVVTFGGAYAVLSYVAQEAVQNFGWLRPGEMIDGLGMAETTPGPLVQVVQFVGFLAAYRDNAGMDPWIAAVLASVLVTWVTFAPSFLWIFLGAPYVEKLQSNARLSAALSAITAAVVGVILNLAVWFGLNVMFAAVAEVHAYGLRLYVPALPTLDFAAAGLAIAAAVVLLGSRVGMLPVLAAGAVIGAVYKTVF